MQVKQVMTRGVECVRPDDSIPAAAEHLRELGMGALPVCGENNRLVGMITDADLGAAKPVVLPTRIREVMRPSMYCFEDQDATEVAWLMRSNAVRRLAVLDREMRLVGLVWLSDVEDRHDEELVANARAAIARLASQPR